MRLIEAFKPNIKKVIISIIIELISFFLFVILFGRMEIFHKCLNPTKVCPIFYYYNGCNCSLFLAPILGIIVILVIAITPGLIVYSIYSLIEFFISRKNSKIKKRFARK